MQIINDIVEFVAHHQPKFRYQELRHGLMIDTFTNHRGQFEYWTLNEYPGHCAVQSKVGPIPGTIILGLSSMHEVFEQFAEVMVEHPYNGVVGLGDDALWFAGRASELGITFHDVEPQQIYGMKECELQIPTHIKGEAKIVLATDIDWFTEWLQAFAQESSPYGPIPDSETCRAIIDQGRYYYWEVKGEPVAIAGLTRQLECTTAITGVYTRPNRRGHGYAAAITAKLCQLIFIEHKRTATLYTDIRNAAANKCYRRLGFKCYHKMIHLHRQQGS